jgi:hypothetical protein
LRYTLGDELVHGHYAGSTYVSYPTGIGAALLVYQMLTHPHTPGVYTSANIDEFLPKDALLDLLRKYHIMVEMPSI